MKFPVYELVDRYAIALLKDEKFTEGNREEVEFYEQQLKQDYDLEKIQHMIQDLVKVHRTIWSMEDDFKKGRIDNEPLEVIGQRALDIRDMNGYRVEIKNNIANVLGIALREKKSYAGEKFFRVTDFHPNTVSPRSASSTADRTSSARAIMSWDGGHTAD